MRVRGLRKAIILGLCIPLAACAGPDGDVLTSSLTDTNLPNSVTLVQHAQRQFSEGHFGSAVDAYAKTLERDPLNADAWLGLAAAYDQVARFDEADKAYNRVQELVGPTPSILNNLGYSYLLRGNLDKSRKTLAAAYAGDRENPYILNNIEILNQRLVTLGHPPMVMN